MAEELATTQEGAVAPDEPAVASAAAEATAGEEEEERGWVTSLFTPEAIAMLTLAAVVDGGEFLVEFIPFAGQILSGIIDIVALAFIGGWMYFRSGTTESREKAKGVKKGVELAGKGIKLAKKTKKIAKWVKWGSVLFELVPVLSSIFPFWLVAVILELKYGGR